MHDYLTVIGVMTGNSLDAVDVVLTRFYKDNKIEDIAFYSLPYPKDLADKLRQLRQFIMDNNGNMPFVAKNSADFDNILNDYTNLVATAVLNLIDENDIDKSDIDLIGFHGQTCAHMPPSIAKDKKSYTVQIGDGQKLAQLTSITVAYDFRSDDVMAGGEGAPLAPMHNQHLAEALKVKGDFPITFINGGNTSNLAHTTIDKNGNDALMGWDAGPFNHFPDYIARKYFNQPCDMNGEIGVQGKINSELLEQLFDNAAVKSDGTNFLEASPPKSSDPQWYKAVPLLEDDKITPQDKMRTAEYFAAYITYHTLGHSNQNIKLPNKFAIFGGGWKNPIVRGDFESLLKGEHQYVLDKHQKWFADIKARIGNNVEIKLSDDYGFSGLAMEARIFADMARCLVIGKPFSQPATTGIKHSVVCGVFAFSDKISKNLQKWLDEYNCPVQSKTLAIKWSRASNE